MPKRIALLTVILSLALTSANAQFYSAGLIPDSLKENAHAVIREYLTEFELQTFNKGTERIKKVITILDREGDDYGILKVIYDRDSRINIYDAAVFNGSGKKIMNIKQSEIKDIPAYGGSALYSDHRERFYKPSCGEYPYTLVYEYEMIYSNLISYGSWYPFYGYNISVEHSKLTFIHPPDIQYKKKEINITPGTTATISGGKIADTWECGQIRAMEYEPFDISLAERIPKIYLMPVKLAYDEFTGNASDWKEYGKWISDMYSGRDELAEPEKIKVDSLLENISDTIERIQILYRYMQGHTRYVGIQLGIGGLQPFPAKTVVETGYGDCKALSNYMHSMLKQAGIVSYPALVSSGVNIETIYRDFPNFLQFDHVILCVPLKSDTIWLECTNQNIPFGFLGDFTDDRDVLLITGEGGKFAHTRKYRASDNIRSGRAELIIDPGGNANCSISIRYQGLQYNDIYGMLYLSPEEQKKWVYKNSDLPSQQLKDLKVVNSRDIIPSALINETMESKNYCSFTGNYMILPLNRVNVQPPVRKVVKERLSDFIIQRSTADYDTVVYRIPESYAIESVPQGKIITSAFGDYTCSVSADSNKVVYSRMFKINQGRFKASEYKNFYDFILSVSRADNEKLMLVRQK